MGKERVKIDVTKLEQIIRVASEKTRTYSIHDGVEYGIFQEFATNSGGRPRRVGGTTGKGHPSLVPAFERHTKVVPELIGQALERGVSLDDVLSVVAFNIMADWQIDVNVDTGAYKNSIMVTPE